MPRIGPLALLGIVREVEVRILGPLEVVGDDGQSVDVGGSRPQTLLVALALAGGHPLPADQLLEEVWSGEGRPDRNRLQVHISRLRRALGEAHITRRGGGYALELPAEAVDATRFERLLAAGRSALSALDAEAASRLFGDALSLWRGSPLAEFADHDFARPVITRLEESRLAATEDRIEADLMLDRHDQLTGELDGLVRQHPLRERMWGQLIIALYRCGRQGDALRAYQRARSVLADELGVDPGPALRQLERAVLNQDPNLGPSPPQHTDDRPRRLDNLPAAPSALIGRKTELAAVASLLHDSRVVTIVGTGGVGKTRVAIEVARRVLGVDRDGVWLIELAPVSDPRTVPMAVATALGVEPGSGPGATTDMAERLCEFLSPRQMLLVLDNCEHVVAEAARVVDHLMRRCPDLRILATSRERLAVDGESQWPLPPLGPAEASELFVARAQAVAPDFTADETTMTVVRTICARLDGLPLAIELAAARMHALTPSDVLDRLDNRFRLLSRASKTAVPRQQTLRAVIDWSYGLLSDQERRVFERMSVFAGDCTLSAAEQVCADDTIPRDDIADLLARLVDKSLLATTRTREGIRFRLLQTLAEYGRERLANSGDLAAARARHARWVASFTCVDDADYGPAWFNTVSESLDDIRLATESAIDSNDYETALAIVCGLGWFWDRGGVTDNLWRWFTDALAIEQPATARRVRVLALAEHIAVAHGVDDASSYGEQAVELGRIVGDRQALAFATVLHGSALGGLYHQRGRAVSLLEESAALFDAEGDDWSLASAASARGVAALAQTDPDRAWPLLPRRRRPLRGQGQPLGRGHPATPPRRPLHPARPLRRRHHRAERGADRPHRRRCRSHHQHAGSPTRIPLRRPRTLRRRRPVARPGSRSRRTSAARPHARPSPQLQGCYPAPPRSSRRSRALPSPSPRPLPRQWHPDRTRGNPRIPRLHRRTPTRPCRRRAPPSDQSCRRQRPCRPPSASPRTRRTRRRRLASRRRPSHRSPARSRGSPARGHREHDARRGGRPTRNDRGTPHRYRTDRHRPGDRPN